jgi:aldehyde:ferredoxin oxidoreductase
MFDAEDEAVQVNNLEVAYHDPRGASGMALTYATSPRGACHNQSDYMMVDAWQALPSLGISHHDRLGGPEKSPSVARHQDWRTLCNSLVLCIFANLEPELVLPLINSACGLVWTIDDMMKCGERGWNLKRAINNRLGLTRSNDRLPRGLSRPFRDDPDTPYPFDFNAMLDAYYVARGWDLNSGYPTPDKLRELGLDFIIEDLP